MVSPVADGAGAEPHLQAEPLPEHPLEDLQLDLAHQVDPDLPGLLVPAHMELWVLLLELPQVPEGRVGVCPLRQQHLIGEHRLQGRCGSGGLDPQALSGPAAGEARDRADGARRGLVHGAEPGAGVDADLVRLLLPHLVLRQIRAAVGQHRLDPELPAGDLQIGQAVPLAVPGDLEDPGAEVRWVIRDGGIPRQAFQESSDPLQLQGGAEPAGKQLP